MLVDDAAAAATANQTMSTSTTPMQTPDESSLPPIFEGSCFCKSVSWRIEGEPLISVYCHCTICQRMNGAAFVHGLHLPVASFTWTTPTTSESSTSTSNNSKPISSTPNTVLQMSSTSTPWMLHRCKYCHTYIGAINSKTNAWTLKSAHLKRDTETNLIEGFERIRPTAHIFYGTRMLDVPDGLPKWEGYENQSRRLELA